MEEIKGLEAAELREKCPSRTPLLSRREPKGTKISVGREASLSPGARQSRGIKRAILLSNSVRRGSAGSSRGSHRADKESRLLELRSFTKTAGINEFNSREIRNSKLEIRLFGAHQLRGTAGESRGEIRTGPTRETTREHRLNAAERANVSVVPASGGKRKRMSVNSVEAISSSK